MALKTSGYFFGHSWSSDTTQQVAGKYVCAVIDLTCLNSGLISLSHSVGDEIGLKLKFSVEDAVQLLTASRTAFFLYMYKL